MRTIGALCVILALTLAACGKGAGVSAVSGDDMTLGPEAAKVTVIEYASVSCPVCAKWNNENWDGFKKKYIDSGRIRYVLREALTHNPTVAAAGFAMARCAGKDKYFDVVDALYHARDAIEESPTPRDNMLAIAKSTGMSEQQFQACVGNPETLAAIQKRWEDYATKDKIDGTPTFIIGGKQLVGDVAMTDIDKAITDAEKAAPQ